MSAAAIQPLREPLTAVDRCDRCGAQAYARATMAGGVELLFCAHHWGVHRDAVTSVALEVADETAKLRAT